MSAKKSSNKPKSEIPDSIELNEEQKKWPEAKALHARMKKESKRREIETQLNPILEEAGKKLGVKFSSLSALVKYVENKKGSGTRAKRLTDEQKTKIDQMKVEKKTAKEIADAVGCKESQVNVYWYNKDK
jgi:hypothetical protein